jgi:hypothetical protein
MQTDVTEVDLVLSKSFGMFGHDNFVILLCVSE